MEFLIAIKRFILETFHGAAPIFFGIFILVFLTAIIARIVLTILLNHAYKKLAKLKKMVEKFPTKSKKYIKEEEELRRKIESEVPRAHSEVKAEMRAKAESQRNLSGGGSYEIIPSNDQEQDNRDLNEINIVDIVKPIGFWTSVILGQKLTFLIKSAQIINKRGDKGFWASMIEAKEREAGKQHARGR